jgi:hypothetical protein
MRSRPRISMHKALADPMLFGLIMSGPSWYSWRVLLIAAAGERLLDDERQEFRRLTKREHEPGQPVKELVLVAGRRAGKSTAMCVLAIWIASLCDHRYLAPGEVGVVLMVSRDQRVSRMLVDRIAEVMALSEPLASMIVNRTQDTIDLVNNVRIELRPASFINLRGPSYLCILADEVAFWFTSTDFSNPDVEVLAAAKPCLLTTGGPMVLISSAYSQTGVLYDAWRRYFGPAGPPDILVAHATSRDLNPSLDQAEIDRAIERDPVRNRAEYLSNGGATSSASCLGKSFSHAHKIISSCRRSRESLIVVLLIKPAVSARIPTQWRSPTNMARALLWMRFFSPAVVVNDVLVPLCNSYGVHSVSSDNYASGFSQALIHNAGLGFAPAKKHKSELYLELLPLLNSQRISLPRNDCLVNQIAGLERSTQRSGRDFIDHAPNSH